MYRALILHYIHLLHNTCKHIQFQQSFSSHLTAPPLQGNIPLESYVYWTAHHLDSWVKRDQLDVTCFTISLLNAQHVSDVNTSILRSLWLMCWVISWVTLIWFNVCWSYVAVWLWWCGIRMQAEALELRCGLAVVVWYPYAGWGSGVTLRFGCGGLVSVCRLRQCLSLHTDTTPPQPNRNVTPTHIEPDQCNPWNNSTHKSQAPEDGCINIRNMLSIK